MLNPVDTEMVRYDSASSCVTLGSQVDLTCLGLSALIIARMAVHLSLAQDNHPLGENLINVVIT